MAKPALDSKNFIFNIKIAPHLMKKIAHSLFFLPLLFLIINVDNLAFANQGTCALSNANIWVGIEIMSVDDKTAKLIRATLPIEPGITYFQNEPKLYKSWCNQVKKIVNQDVECDYTQFIDGESYFNIEVTPHHYKYKFRSIPFHLFQPKIPSHVLVIYEQWEEKWTELFEAGIDPKETHKSGYLD